MIRKCFQKLPVRIFAMLFLVVVLPFTLMLYYVKGSMESLLREEISLKIVQNLSRSENEISQILSRMASISNVFFGDPEFMGTFGDESASYYKRSLVFDRVREDIARMNLYDQLVDDVNVTFLDREGQAYASWSLNYGDYAYLLEQSWVRESVDARGYIVWNMAAEGYRPGREDAGEIALARSIMDPYATSRSLGTLIIGVGQEQIGRILEGYKYAERDFVFASSHDGEMLFHGGDAFPAAEAAKVVGTHLGQDNGNDAVTIGGTRYLVSYYTVDGGGMMSGERLKIFYLTDYRHLDSQLGALVTQISILCAVFALIISLMAIYIAHQISSPTRAVSRLMAGYRVGDPPVSVPGGVAEEIGEIYTSYNNMSVHIGTLFQNLRQEQATREKYYYESLRSKMSPHFLFNTLTSIRWMAIIRKADNIRDSIDALAAILEYSLRDGEENVPLSCELDIVVRYCHIQNVRFGGACSLDIDVPGALRERHILKFILQPAVENCFKHAFRGELRHDAITVSGRVEDGTLRLAVTDNGVGFPPAFLEDFRARRENSGSGGLGLRIVDERVRVAYGEGYGLALSNGENGGARVEYILPV